MIYAGSKQLRAGISEGLLPVYLFYGEDIPAMEAETRWLRGKILEGGPSAGETVFDGRAAVDVDQLADAVWSMSFMGARRCVRLEDLRLDSIGAGQADKLWQLLGDLSSQATLIITAWTQPPRPGKQGPGAKLLEICAREGGVCAFPKLGRSGLQRRAREMAGEQGCEMDSQAAELLAGRCAADQQRMAAEIPKLCAYAMGRGIVREDVEKLVPPAAEARVFQLSDKILQGDLSGAMETVGDLLFQREPETTVLSILSMAFVDMYRASAARRAGAEDQDARKAYGYGGSGYRYSQGLERQRRYTPLQLERALWILADADSRMKTTGASSRVILETAVARLFYSLRK